MIACKQVGTLLLVFLVSRVSCMDEDMAELAKMLRDSCAGETGVDISLVEKVNAGTDLMSVQDKILKCYIKCTMETAGMFSDGAVDIEAVVALLPDDLRSKNEAALRACGTKQGADHCDTAFLTQVCWQQANKADYFLI
ncbi:Odorant binding protein [Operophtera brumata]|uniref:Odorant binding protein n=1 Tax=Operophtera brumata TaxID=104452 RepID=A0A0L7L606_OPEBR|nr:Odorant binding protein [Operophtera brumata]